jgi:hypothetical protein
MFAIASARGQGIISLAPVPVTNGVTGTLAPSSVLAALYYGPSDAPESSLSPLVAALALSSGYARFGVVTVPGYLPFTSVEVEVRAWDDSSGLYPGWAQAQPAWQAGLIAAAESMLVDAVTGSGVLPPAPTAIPGFTILQVPEPSSVVLGLLALGLWRTWRAKAR